MERLTEIRSIAGPVSRETLDRLHVFEAEFKRWNTRINLASSATLDKFWKRHILDSAQLMSLTPARRWVDLGSGGGFPGAVVAILLRERAGSHVTLVESNRKKAAFLAATLGHLEAPATVIAVRAEEAAKRVGGVEIVTARALAPLPTLLGLAAPWLHEGARGLFHKGRDYASEVLESRDGWTFDLVEHASRIDSAGRILEISALKQKGRSAAEA